MSTSQSKTVRTQTFQLTQIEGPDGKPVIATIHPSKKGCVVKFSHDEERPLMNYVKKREKDAKEQKEEKKQFSVFIPKNHTMVLRMLTNQKGKIVPHRNNPKRLFLFWEHVVVETNITYNGKKGLQATFRTSEKKDKKGRYYQTTFGFYTENGEPITYVNNGKEQFFIFCYKTEDKNEVTDAANRKWLLQEGQIVPHEKYEGLTIRLGKAPEKTSITIEIDGKQIPVFTKYRVCKDPNNPRIFVVKYFFYVNQQRIMHYNSSNKRVHFTYYRRTNNPRHVTDEAIKHWYSNSQKKIVPHKDGGGQLWLK